MIITTSFPECHQSGPHAGQRSLLCSSQALSAAGGDQGSLDLAPTLTLSSVAMGSDHPSYELPPGLYTIAFADADQPGALRVLVHRPGGRRRRDPALTPAGLDTCPAEEAARRACMRRTLSALRAAVSCRCKAVERPREARGRDASAENLSTSVPELTLPGPSPAPLLPAAPVAVLFSGGVDSTLLAALAHECLEPALPIDLVSICFDGGASPDRASALDALAELAAWAPARRWRLLLLDAMLADVDLHAPRLLRLLRPADTVMDLNIGAALWLAARARAPRLRAWDPESLGMLETAAEPGRCFESAARVVLVGHGADEVFGGYGACSS